MPDFTSTSEYFLPWSSRAPWIDDDLASPIASAARFPRRNPNYPNRDGVDQATSHDGAWVVKQRYVVIYRCSIVRISMTCRRRVMAAWWATDNRRPKGMGQSSSPSRWRRHVYPHQWQERVINSSRLGSDPNLKTNSFWRHGTSSFPHSQGGPPGPFRVVCSGE